jgi:hypothetical protein
MAGENLLRSTDRPMRVRFDIDTLATARELVQEKPAGCPADHAPEQMRKSFLQNHLNSYYSYSEYVDDAACSGVRVGLVAQIRGIPI